jgi:hypothetical protein
MQVKHIRKLQKKFRKSESSGRFLWKLFPVQRKKRGQHQLFVNWEDKQGFSNGSMVQYFCMGTATPWK